MLLLPTAKLTLNYPYPISNPALLSLPIMTGRQEVSKDRDCLERRTAAALRAKANMEPLKFVSIQADAANQTCFALPMCSPVTHGTDK